jgi:hypothetical protein
MSNALLLKDNGQALKDACNLMLDSNYNLTPAQKELQLWHQHLGHCGHQWVQDLMRQPKHIVGEPVEQPLLPTRKDKTSTCDAPKCAACQLVKPHRIGTGTMKKSGMDMVIHRDDLQPGNCVSTDQFYSANPGRLLHAYGKEGPVRQYHGGTVFYDHASAYWHVSNQVSLGMGETLQSKHAFERFARASGVNIKSYRADNHPYQSKEFLADLEMQGQSVIYSGVGAHHQNGTAKRIIMTVMYWSRTMMIHQLLHWPDKYSSRLWPFVGFYASIRC